MSLHLVEMPLSLRALHLWAGRRNLKGEEGAALHHLLGEAFGPAAMQPFRLMVAPRAREGSLYAYSSLDAPSLATLASAVMTPDLAEVIDLSCLRSLPRPTTWVRGQRLGFDLRLRPVVRLASAVQGQDETGAPVNLRAGAEVDAFLAAALRGQGSDREKNYLDWLANRLVPAAALDLSCSRLAAFERRRILRGGRWIEGPDAVIHGTLTVTDPAAFAERLAKGIGRHRSYGYGMLLLRPAQRPRRC